MRRWRFREWFVLILLMVPVVGCGGTEGDIEVNLESIPTDVPYNESVVLEWSTTNADSCTASGAWSGEKEVNGTEEFGPLTADVSFTLTCTNIDSEASKTVNVTVGDPTTPDTPTVSLNADPSAVDMNGATTLSWSSQNTDTCTASGAWSGSKAVSGEETTAPLTEDSTFVIDCEGTGGSVTATVTVIVSGPSDQPTVTLEADPTNVEVDGATTLTWSSSNTVTCEATDGWTDSNETNGQATIEALQETTTFSMTCQNSEGVSATASVEVTVGTVATGTATLRWTPPTQNTDGTELTDLAGYKIYVGSASGEYGEPITVNDNTIDSYVVENLAAGTWFFAVSAVDTSGNESTKSNEESKVVTIP